MSMRDATPASDASVVGASPADLRTSVHAFFAAFPDEDAPRIEELPAVQFFDVLLSAEEAELR